MIGITSIMSCFLDAFKPEKISAAPNQLQYTTLLICFENNVSVSTTSVPKLCSEVIAAVFC